MPGNETILYHGSNVVVENPQILISGFYKDFGYGFYCTNIEKQARKWALTKRGSSIGPICEVIDNYNSSAYYEPSHYIARSYFAGGF